MIPATESEILKFICANHGAVNTDDLVYNLCSGDPDIINNREKFVPYCLNGQPKVVARTTLTLCNKRNCPGSCMKLHICKAILFSGSCQYSQFRTGCSFSHELNSDHNVRILGVHELESLSLMELRTLLLQNDDRLLPPVNLQILLLHKCMNDRF
uniref:PARP12-like CCCH zinc finger tandem domain-containing protein n=1 Tax=Monopterus albus TaxID=43700 RepID=A0A3Q3IUX1_MONAL